MNITKLRELEPFNGLNIISFILAGSRLHGTHSENSDYDYKGVYVPCLKEYILRTVRPSIRFKEGECDIELYSLDKFMELLYNGDTTAISMLHARNDNLIHQEYSWNYLVSSRDQFYTKRIVSFVQFARSQAAKYGAKGSRLKAMRVYLDFISEVEHRKINDEAVMSLRYWKLKDVWDELPRGEHIYFHDADPANKRPYRMVEICGQNHQETETLSYFQTCLARKYSEAGDRARKAEANDGLDWKALAHAIRVAYEVVELCLFKDIVYPLNFDILKMIKAGEADFNKMVSPLLETYISYAEQLIEASDFPEEVDKDFWDFWLTKIVFEESTIKGLLEKKLRY